ncbi:alpha/beta hydrolase [Pseudomonas sp. RIT-PI-AD]|uniref:alpha/beta fold hydrolase n=1 Tax=Pseudomonas sp. RIT-PI-AD TaxID=3035294 RepID=UPI0021D927FB|nr:alpha/beta hydrolase [Pseudomonas sp. RIT-PI-AD]
MSTVVEEVRLNLPHIELAARLYGPEHGKPVIALHGWLDNAASFARLAPKLQGVRILALDFAGHGYSAHRPVGCSYSFWDNVHDVLEVAAFLGWERFSLLGHSMGAIVSVMLAAALPERVERLALIDGLIPPTGEADQTSRRLGDALRAQLALPGKRKPIYAELEHAVTARMKSTGAVSREAAELLAQRGLMAVAGGYTWRSDPRLTLPSPLRLTHAHALALLDALRCPARLVVAERGILLEEPRVAGLLEGLSMDMRRVPGGHHLHLDDEAGAEAVAACFEGFFEGA